MSRFTDWVKSRQIPPFRKGARGISAAAQGAQADVFPHQAAMGIGNEWANPDHAEYYAKSIPVYTPITIRGNAMAKIPWKVQRRLPSGDIEELGPEHPAQQLLDHPNPWFTGAELRRATEINMCLFGRAFWSIEPSLDGTTTELWVLRPDRLKVLPGRGRQDPYIRGYRYQGLTRDHLYLPEEIEFFRFFNPLQDRTGLSPVAPLRLTADMGLDALKYNRNTLRNGAIPDYLLLGNDEMTDTEIESFYRRWEERFQGPNRANRPAITSNIKDVKALAFSNREMEFSRSLQFSLSDAARAFNVPPTMMADLTGATLANMEKLEQIFWQDTIQPQATMYAERLTSRTLPALGFSGLEVVFDYTDVQALNEGAEVRSKREHESLDRGLLTINEVRKTYNLSPVDWGDVPHFRAAAGFPSQNPTAERTGPDA